MDNDITMREYSLIAKVLRITQSVALLLFFVLTNKEEVAVCVRSWAWRR